MEALLYTGKVLDLIQQSAISVWRVIMRHYHGANHSGVPCGAAALICQVLSHNLGDTLFSLLLLGLYILESDTSALSWFEGLLSLKNIKFKKEEILPIF